jgi:catechol 2,3-dioxygenase-like lactoylglutathione lyase family enzyme
MSTYLEHANITVPDIDAAIRFLKLVDPDFVVRHDGKSESGYRWAHVGNDNFYIALEEPRESDGTLQEKRPYQDYGVHHIGWVVDDFEATFARLDAGGYRKGQPPEPHPWRERAYFFDEAGLEWEILGYQSDNPAQRNSYSD